MDTLQEQVNLLAIKVEALSQRIEQMSLKVGEVVTECKFGADQIQQPDTRFSTPSRPQRGPGVLDGSLDHKDILADSNGLESTTQSNDRPLAPEVQIQRLTAQLTAAYNRIAALEEQLLSKRLH